MRYIVKCQFGNVAKVCSQIANMYVNLITLISFSKIRGEMSVWQRGRNFSLKTLTSFVFVYYIMDSKMSVWQHCKN